MLKAVLSVVVFLAMLGLALGQEVSPKYVCTGSSSQGGYELNLAVEHQADNYFLTWYTDKGVSTQGMGYVHDDMLVVVVVSPNGGLGVASYKVSKGTLVGKWSGGDGKVWSETCTQGKSLSL